MIWWLLLGWTLVSIPVGVLVGKMIKGCAQQPYLSATQRDHDGDDRPATPAEQPLTTTGDTDD